MPTVGSENFFDGFSFESYRERFSRHETTVYDNRESQYPTHRPLLPFLGDIAASNLPLKWERRTHAFVKNDDWLLMDHALARGQR